MNPHDHVAQLRLHLTVVVSDPVWNADTMAQYVRDLIDQNEGMDRVVSVEVFDEKHELAEMRRTLDKAFRVIGTGAIKMLEDGDGWERFRALLAALRAFIEVGERYTSSLGSEADPGYKAGEEDGYVTAIGQLEKIVEMCEGK